MKKIMTLFVETDENKLFKAIEKLDKAIDELSSARVEILKSVELIPGKNDTASGN